MVPHRRTRRDSDEFRGIATERVERLLELADAAFRDRPDLADRYVRLAWRLKTRYNVRLPPHLRRKFCKKCLTFLRPGTSCRVRVVQGRVIVTCLLCGHQVRLPFGTKRAK